MSVPLAPLAYNADDAARLGIANLMLVVQSSLELQSFLRSGSQRSTAPLTMRCRLCIRCRRIKYARRWECD
jgi:hypothetical protein